MTNNLWTVVLAAGAGRRLSALTAGVPKQFYRGVGGRSLLRHTLDRFAPLAPRSRTVIVVDASHTDYLAAEAVRDDATVVVQPQDRGTAAGVLLALTPVLGAAPGEIVAITPSDHGVRDDVRFRAGVQAAAEEAERTDAIVLFGVEPEDSHDDYGWISVGRAGYEQFAPVRSFVEKPARDVARRLMAGGAVWNTMVIVGRAGAIRDLYAELLPTLEAVFSAVRQLPAAERLAVLARAYPALPCHDFSRDLLGQARRLSAYVWPAAMGWSDLGTPQRLQDWLRRDPRSTTVSAA